MTIEEERGLKASKEHRQVKELRKRVQFLESELAIVGELLHECLTKKFYNEHRASADWLARVQELFPPVEGERR
jgi:hypothetical protein